MDNLILAIVGLIAIASSVLILIALFAVLWALFPRQIAPARAIAESLPGRSLLIGLVNVLFLGAAAAALGGIAQATGAWPLGILALIAMLLLGGAAVLGLAAVAAFVGARLAPGRGQLGQLAAGTLALALASLTPYVGWYALLPYVTLLGIGAVIISLFAATRGMAEPAADDDGGLPPA